VPAETQRIRRDGRYEGASIRYSGDRPLGASAHPFSRTTLRGAAPGSGVRACADEPGSSPGSATPGRSIPFSPALERVSKPCPLNYVAL
jgi:hypothetical protein